MVAILTLCFMASFTVTDSQQLPSGMIYKFGVNRFSTEKKASITETAKEKKICAICVVSACDSCLSSEHLPPG